MLYFDFQLLFSGAEVCGEKILPSTTQHAHIMSEAKKQKVERAEGVSGADIALIQNVLNRVMLSMDDGDGAAFASCFTVDGTCHVNINQAHKTGPQELAGLAVFLHAKFKTCRHWEGNVCVSAGAQAGLAINTSYWKALDGGETVSTGIHRDTLVFANGQWLVKSRVIVHTWTKAGGHTSHPEA